VRLRLWLVEAAERGSLLPFRLRVDMALVLQRRADTTQTMAQCESGQTLQHVSVKMVNSAWAGDVRWVCSRG
jgi:hypothetical protein